MIIAIGKCYAENNYRVISQSSLNVRKSTSTMSDIIGTFQSGQEIEVKSVKNGWAKVNFNGKTGYVLVEYIQPISNNSSHIVSKSNDNVMSSTPNDQISSVYEDSFESERKSSMYEIGYSASSFDDVKFSGSYGFSWTMLPWKVAPQLYAGIHFSPAYFNFGLVDSDYTTDVIKLGPVLGYYFTPKICVMAPLDLMCVVYFEGNDTKTSWGMSLTPSIYIGNKGGVFLGPQFTIGFESGSKFNCGFRAGIYF